MASSAASVASGGGGPASVSSSYRPRAPFATPEADRPAAPAAPRPSQQRIEGPTTVPQATAVVAASIPPPGKAAFLATALGSGVASINSSSAPSYNSLGQALPPGKGHGVAIATARGLPHTVSGSIKDPFKRYDDHIAGAPHESAASAAAAAAGGGVGAGDSGPLFAFAGRPPRTLSELRAQRKLAMRADPSYDLDGDGTVSQKDYFFASEWQRWKAQVRPRRPRHMSQCAPTLAPRAHSLLLSLSLSLCAES
jgi:hypothetical protein